MDIEGVRRLLTEWATYVLSEEANPTGLGYPSASPGAEQSGSVPKRRQSEQRAHDRLSDLAQRTGHWRINPEGKRERMMDMVAQPNPKQTRSARPKSPRYEPWPADIRDVHQAVMLLPKEESAAIAARYVHRMGRPSAAAALKITQTAFRERLARAEGAIRATLDSMAA